MRTWFQTVLLSSEYVYVQFPVLEGSINVSDLSDTKIVSKITNINKVFTFYLVRHGQAEHNLYTKTTIKRKTDTSLTNFGMSTPKNAGIAINSDIKNNGKIKKLIRTWQHWSDLGHNPCAIKIACQSPSLVPDADWNNWFQSVKLWVKNIYHNKSNK